MIRWIFEQFDTVESTMNILHDWARDGAPEGLVILANHQTAGRGRSGNVWIAPEGNFYASILLRPTIHAQQAGQYSFITAVALARTFSDLISPSYKFEHKWPNDVLIETKKGAGILLESEIQDDGKIAYLNIGVGVNLKYAPEGRIALADVSAHDITVPDFTNAFLNHLNDVILSYNHHGFSVIRDEWLAHAHGLLHPIKVRMPNETIEGIFNGIREDGALHLQLPDGPSQFIHSGDVFFGWDDQIEKDIKGQNHVARG